MLQARDQRDCGSAGGEVSGLCDPGGVGGKQESVHPLRSSSVGDKLIIILSSTEMRVPAHRGRGRVHACVPPTRDKEQSALRVLDASGDKVTRNAESNTLEMPVGTRPRV